MWSHAFLEWIVENREVVGNGEQFWSVMSDVVSLELPMKSVWDQRQLIKLSGNGNCGKSNWPSALSCTDSALGHEGKDIIGFLFCLTRSPRFAISKNQ